VRKYVLEGWGPGKTWQPLCDGISIGHKRIQWFDAVEVAKVRLRLTESVAEPIIRTLALYDAA
jgi:alpha-L-fucosidase